ncbi:MAG: hybrid sensor histidine kinase/response regulator [Opitutales bacterium]|nr:hybrid sensor histidine kinase/response regulator [Opitutales bacterium]
MKDLLKGEPWRVLFERGGADAIATASAEQPDLILLDIMMPGMDGFETCRRLKENAAFEDVPVIFMTALDDTESKVKAFAAGGVDFVTKPVQKEETLARIKAQLQLRRLRDELKREIDAKDEAIKDLDGYAHTVAHDLKNPLQGLMVLTETLLSEGESVSEKERLEWTKMIHEASTRLNNIVHELLIFASVRQQDVEAEPVDMVENMRSALFRVQTLVEGRRARLILPDSLPVAHAYGSWTEEVWANLISNAVKYGGNPPVVEVGGHYGEDGRPVFWVKDNGNGIAPENIDRLFETFTRLEHARAEGTGLGLSIVKRILQKLDGLVTVDSKVGEGSIFAFSLPPAATPQREHAAARTAVTEPS